MNAWSLMRASVLSLALALLAACDGDNPAPTADAAMPRHQAGNVAVPDFFLTMPAPQSGFRGGVRPQPGGAVQHLHRQQGGEVLERRGQRNPLQHGQVGKIRHQCLDPPLQLAGRRIGTRQALVVLEVRTAVSDLLTGQPVTSA